MDVNIYNSYLKVLARDERITVWHLAVVFAILHLATDKEYYSYIFISRAKVMAITHIKSIVTYHKCISDLQKFGYIQYTPSYHPAFGSRIFLLKR